MIDDRNAPPNDPWAPLCRAAIAAHWMPDVGFRLRQQDGRSLHVASWPSGDSLASIDVHPCEFRRVLVQTMIGERCGMSGWLEPVGTDHIELVVGPTAEIGPFGLVNVRIDAATSTIAIALSAAEARVAAEQSGGSQCSQHGVRFDRDDELGAVLAHTCYPSDDGDAEQRAFSSIIDVVASAVATDLVAAAAATGPAQ